MNAYSFDRDWSEYVKQRIRKELAEYQAFAAKHGPQEPILRLGKLVPVEELIAGIVAKMLED